MKPRPARVGTTPWLLFLAAPLIWFAHFNALYGIASFARLPGDGPWSFTAVAWVLTALACLAAMAAWLRIQRLAKRQRVKHGLGDMAGWLAALSLAGILFQGLALALM